MAKENAAKVSSGPDLLGAEPDDDEQGPPGKFASGTRRAVSPSDKGRLILVMVAAFALGAAMAAALGYGLFKVNFLDGGGVKTCTARDVGTSCGTNMQWCGPPTVCRCKSSCQ
jgi:hypothetical protein